MACYGTPAPARMDFGLHQLLRPYPSLQVSNDGIRVSKERDRRAGNVPHSPEAVPDEVGPRGIHAPFAVAVDGVHHAASPVHVRVGAHVRHVRGEAFFTARFVNFRLVTRFGAGNLHGDPSPRGLGLG